MEKYAKKKMSWTEILGLGRSGNLGEDRETGKLRLPQHVKRVLMRGAGRERDPFGYAQDDQAELRIGLAGAADYLGLMQAGDAGDGGYHHAGKQLHGGYVAFVEGAGS